VTFLQPPRLLVRRATRHDYRAISRLLDDNWAVHTRLLPEDIKAKLEQYITFVVEDQITLRGFFMVEPQPPKIGLVVVVALHDNAQVSPFLDLVLPAVEEELRKQNLEILLQIGYANWLTCKLHEYGFVVQDEVITFEWKQQPLPDLPPHPSLQIRSAHFSDLPTLLTLDQMVFGPTWRKPRIAFREALVRAVSFKVGLIGNKIVAYEWCDQFGDHGHLTRLATHPDYQRQGIASHLLRCAIEELVKLKVKTVSVNTQKHNLRSQKLYLHFGFTPTSQVIAVYQKEVGK
jgi:ribosomal-protein-alanine N-acetyltransferase